MTKTAKQIADAAYYQRNKERIKANNKAWRAKNMDKMRPGLLRYSRTPKGQFVSQRERAKQRGVEWRLSFEEWLAWWGDDISKRGKEPHELCMSRKGDTGAYALGNIEKKTNKDNLQEGLEKRWAK